MDAEQLKRLNHAFDNLILAVDALPKKPRAEHSPSGKKYIKNLKRQRAKGCPTCGYELAFDHAEGESKWYSCTRPGCTVMLKKVGK